VSSSSSSSSSSYFFLSFFSLDDIVSVACDIGSLNDLDLNHGSYEDIFDSSKIDVQFKEFYLDGYPRGGNAKYNPIDYESFGMRHS